MSNNAIEIKQDPDIELVTNAVFDCLETLNVTQDKMGRIHSWCKKQLRREGPEKWKNYYKVLAASVEKITGLPVIDRNTQRPVWMSSKAWRYYN
ncbi:MAG: hypothetical protein ACOWWR_13600 [Eubacteriales bacterium]